MKRLVYRSRSTEKLSWKTVQDILRAATENNEKLGVTGVLAATNTQFWQVLEGEASAVNQTFRRLYNDPRHSDIEIISFKTVQRRMFADWSMRGLALMGELNAKLVFRLKEEFGTKDGELDLPNSEEGAITLAHLLSNYNEAQAA